MAFSNNTCKGPAWGERRGKKKQTPVMGHREQRKEGMGKALARELTGDWCNGCWKGGTGGEALVLSNKKGWGAGG